MDIDVAPCVIDIVRCFPELRIESQRVITDGWDYLVLEVNDTLIFRFPRRPDVEVRLLQEMRLLPVLAETLPLPVPRFEFIWRGDAQTPRPFVGYRKLRGAPLRRQQLAQLDGTALARQLGAFLSALHHFPLARANALGLAPVSLDQWRAEYGALYARIRRDAYPLLASHLRAWAGQLWETFLGEDVDVAFSPTLIHRDLTSDHILWDASTGQLGGILDWGDMTPGDPALDFAGLLYYGDEFVAEALRAYTGPRDARFQQRLVFYARIAPFHAVLFGLQNGDASLVDAGLRQLARAANAS